jgi:hypothetical protein
MMINIVASGMRTRNVRHGLYISGPRSADQTTIQEKYDPSRTLIRESTEPARLEAD